MIFFILLLEQNTIREGQINEFDNPMPEFEVGNIKKYKIKTI